MSIRVVKRDGTVVPIDVYKIKKVIAFACEGRSCDPLELEMDAHVQFRDQITTEEIQTMVIQTAVEKITHETPEWEFVAAKLYLYDIYKKIGDKWVQIICTKNRYSIWSRNKCCHYF